MSFPFRTRSSIDRFFLSDFLIYEENIINEYQNAWDVPPSINNEIHRSCEQKLIKLDKTTLVWDLQQFVRKQFQSWKFHPSIKQTEQKYVPCVLLHLIHVFCIPGQEEKIEVVQVELNEVLHKMTEEEIYDLFERYICQQLKVKSSLTEIDLLTGQIESQHEFQLKLCYWDTFCAKNDKEGCKEFLKKNADFLVSKIEARATNLGFMWHKKLNLIACNILLCLLNWNIFKTRNPVILQNNRKTPAPSSVSLVADPSTNYSFTNRASNMLQKILSTLSEEKIFKAFNDYLEQMYAMNSEITEDDFCIGMIEPYNEFLLKLCYCEALCNKNDAFCMEFLRRNADLFVLQIELVADEENKKWKPISCTILLCLLNLNMCTLKTTPLMVQNTEIQACPSDVSVADTSANYYYTAETIRSILQKLLSILSEDDILTAFNDYLEKIYAMKSEITEDDFCSNKIEPYYECMLKLCYCTGKWSKTEIDFITKNTEFFLSTVEEVNKRNQLRVKFKMCQVLSIIMNGKIHITESMIYSITCYKTDIHFGIVTCLLHLKTKLDNFRKLTEKFSFQYQDHIKELLLSLLTHVLTLIPTQVILEAVYHSFENSCVANQKYQNIQLELAKTFLDISITPKTSHENKLIIGSKIQQTFIIRDTSKTALPPNAEFADSTEEKLDYKRMINICINVLKTESKDINVPMYEGFFCTEKKAIENEVEMIKRSQETETLVLLMFLLITITYTGHHKSSKLKKYLTLKYEYHMASLYLLWCSGDIEVHPGPSLNKKLLAHDSTIERRWIQNISPKILVLLPEHEQSKYKPTKKVRNDMENREHFKTLLTTCLEEKVHVPKMYLAEINAWETKEYKLLHKLFVYRCEIETVIASLKDFLTCGGRTNELPAINISFDTELQTNEITKILGKDHRPTEKSQQMVYITRYIAGILIKCAHGKDPDAKCDGLWDLPLKNWLTGIILFDPNNRGKYSKKYPGQKLISDQELVDILITLPQVTIPQKYTNIVDAYKLMRKNKTKQHKEQLCSTFKRITSLEKLEYALKNLWESGIFTEEVHNNLNKWWTTGALDTADDQKLSQVNIIEVQTRRRPHILINISTKSITLIVEQTDANSSQVSYEFHFDDEFVPLKTMATIVHQTTIRKPSSDSQQKVTEDNQTYSITIPKDKMTVLNSYFPCDLYPNSQAILESDIKRQHKVSSQETAVCSTIHFDKPTSSTNQFCQLNQDIAISGQPDPIVCTPNQSTTNSDDTSSATKDTSNLDFHTQVSKTSDLGSSDSISSVNSTHNISNGGQVILTDSVNSSDSSNNFVSNTYMKKRKFTEEDRNEMKKRKIPSLKQDKKPKHAKETNHRHMDCLMDNTATFNKNREILPDWLLDIDLDSYDIDDQTFKVDLNALDNEDTELGKFLQDMIDCESEKNVTNEII